MSGEILLKKMGNRFDGIRGHLVSDFDMSRITWFQVGGLADIFFQPADEDDLSLFLAKLPEEVPVTIMGVGSNVLVRDKGVEGVVIRLSARGFGYVKKIGDKRVHAGAAVTDKRLAAAALEYGIGGFEFYHGVPGAVGGALRMNAGANGRETCENVVEVIALDRKGDQHQLSCRNMGYSYRSSLVSQDFIFVSALFEGQSGDQHEIRQVMENVQQHRESAQPVREKTGGSTFKNPVGHSAWKLIDEAGMRGFMVGKAKMSSMHCNFMINTGGASANDLENLGERTRERVFENSGVELEWEIRRIGRR